MSEPEPASRAADDPSTAADATAAYDSEELAAALASDVATGTRDDPAADTVVVSPPFRWYRGDFGGKRGILDALRREDVLPADADPALTCGDYDRSPAADLGPESTA